MGRLSARVSRRPEVGDYSIESKIYLISRIARG
jgi:hypothetical protein